MSHFSIKQEAYAAIEAKYRCAHKTRELRLRRIADGRPAYYRQCIRCGHAGNAISTKTGRAEFQSGAIPFFDDELEHQWHAKKSAEYIATYQKIEPSLRAEYDAYLASDAWGARRSIVLARARSICECCEYYSATQVHHKIYERIGQELDTDLMAVCNFCHDLLHGRVAL